MTRQVSVSVGAALLTLLMGAGIVSLARAQDDDNPVHVLIVEPPRPFDRSAARLPEFRGREAIRFDELLAQLRSFR
jgi:hypothetical protein